MDQTDFVRGCSFDLTLKFEPRSVAITDLDADGMAETTFMYALGCRSGLDPLDMKLIMHEGATKYAIRGTSDLSRENRSDEFRSMMTIDPAFDSAPDSLLIFAVRQWNRFDREMEWPSDG